jgi:TolB-like protein/Tfp pilus assembly protein PilF
LSFFEELKRRNVVRVGIAYGVATWLLIQVTDIVFPRIGLPDSAVTLVIALLAIGFIPALIFAWAFEMTPEGIRREADVDRAESITPKTGRKLDRMIISIMALVIAFLLLDRFYLQETPGDTQPEVAATSTSAPRENPAIDEDVPASVAVLPFINMSGDANNEYFSDGLTETLLHMLAQLPELKVAARTSSFAFKGQNANVSEIADTLGVAHILEGSVQKAGQRVRVTAQLIRADDGFHVWSQNYDRTLEDIFAIQDEIAIDVVNALDLSLLGDSRQLVSLSTHDLNAYDSYLKALEQQAVYTYSSMAEAEGLLKQALAQDPGFLDAKLALARNYLMMNGTGLITIEEAHQKMEPLLAQVTATQPNNRTAQALTLLVKLSRADLRKDENLGELVDELRTLLALVPADTYIRSIAAGWVGGFLNEHEHALEIVDAGLLLDPLSAYLYSRRGLILNNLDRLDESKQSVLRAIELQPGYASAYSRMAELHAEMGDLTGMLEWQRRATEIDPQDHELASYLAFNLYMLGLPEEADPWADRVQALAPDSDVAKDTALTRAYWHGNLDQAEALARKMLEDRVTARHGAIFNAVFTYQSLMNRSHRDREAFEFLVSIRPELADFEVKPDDLEGMAMHWGAIVMMRAFSPPEESRQAWENLERNLDATGARWHHEDSNFMMTGQYFRENLEEAVRIALEDDLSEPLATWIGRDEVYRTPVFDQLTADPRIAARLDEREREKEQARLEVQAMLQGPEWN